MKKTSRSIRLGTAASLALVLTLSACGDSGGESAASAGDGNLRWSWWGSDPRHQANEKIIDQYQSANPGIEISGEYSDFSGYWDKLATTTAGGDAPDVITMDEKYLQEYAGRGALADLRELPGLDLTKFDDEVLSLGEYEDGLYGLSTGRNTFAVMINEDLFAQAGVPVPDTTTWTWDDYYRISKEVSDKLGLPGSDYGNSPDASVRLWLRQHGEALYQEEEGTVGFTAETAASYFRHLLTIRDEAGGISAAQWTEDQSGTFEGQSFANNEVAMSWYWSNQLGVLRETSGSNISMHLAPSDTGDPADNGMYFKASMYWSISSQTDDEEAAAEFVNYLANSEEAAKVMLVDRGVPVNPDMAAAVKPELDESDQTVVEFLDAIEEYVADSPQPSPVGTAGVQDVIIRYDSQVLFGDLTPEEAGAQMLEEIKGMI